MAFLKSLTSSLDRLSCRVGSVVSWLALLLTVLTAWDALARYFFKSGSVALQELEWHVFAVMFLLSAGYTLKHEGHVRVDIIYARLGSRGKAAVDTLGAVFFLLPFCALTIYVSFPFIQNSWAVLERSSDPGGLPARYALKAVIPVGFALLFIQGVCQLARSAAALIGAPLTQEKGE